MFYVVRSTGNYSVTDKIFVLQERILRIIKYKPNIAHTEPLLKADKIIYMHDLYKSQVLLLMQGCIDSNLSKSTKICFKIWNTAINNIRTYS